MFGIVVMVIETELSWGAYDKVPALAPEYTHEEGARWLGWALAGTLV